MTFPKQLPPNPEDEKPPIRCLVIQLGSLGDTLQSLMALRAAKQLYPQLEIHVLVQDSASDAVKRTPWIASVVTLPTEALIEPILSAIKSEGEVLRDLARWIGPIVSRPWDLTVNWTFSEASSYLTALVPSRVKLGYTRQRDSTFFAADGWSQYIQGVVQGRLSQNVHLTDILTTQLLTALQIHAGDPVGDGNAPVSSRNFFTLSFENSDLKKPMGAINKRWIAIQLGASHPSKGWDPVHWALLARLIHEEHPDYGFYLLGGKEDTDKAALFLSEFKKRLGSSPIQSEKNLITSFVGETSFDLWASLLGRCHWVFTADTAAIHLASILGTRILNICVGPARYSETGPYGNGHYVVTSEKGVKEPISPEAVYGVWSFAATEWSRSKPLSLAAHFSNLGWSYQLEKTKVLRTRIRESIDGGGVYYEPISNRTLSVEDWTGMVMGHIARSWYCGWVPPMGAEIARDSIHPPLIRLMRELLESSDVLTKICEKASLTATSLQMKSRALKSEKVMGVHDKNELRELGQTLLDLQELLEQLAKTHSPLQAFSNMSKVLLHNLKGDELASLGKETANNYRQLIEGVSILQGWIKFTLNLAKPVAIKKATPPSLSLLERPPEMGI